MENHPNHALTVADRIPLGASGLSASPLGVGTNRWGKDRHADLSLRPVFESALQVGVNLFDTAEIYHFGGAEQTLGVFLQQAEPRPLVTSKFLPLPWRLTRSSLLSALKSSLRRLQLSQVDLYLLHFPLPPVPLETWMDAMAEAVKSGLTRAVGVSNCSAAQMHRAAAALERHGVPLACNQVEYSLVNRNPERDGLLDACRELGVTLVAYRPYTGGLLSGKYSSSNLPPAPGYRRILSPRQYGPVFIRSLQPLLEVMCQLGAAHGGRSCSQVALNWLMRKGALPIPGATDMSHVQENAGALGWALTDDEVALLNAASSAYI